MYIGESLGLAYASDKKQFDGFSVDFRRSHPPQNLAPRARSRYALKTVRFLPILLVALLFCVPTLRAQANPISTGPLIAQSSEGKQVWVNTATGIYHYSGTRWYGKTKQGEFMSEAEARAKGYRPALNGQRRLMSKIVLRFFVKRAALFFSQRLSALSGSHW
jgi:hypothetical protein